MRALRHIFSRNCECSRVFAQTAVRKLGALSANRLPIADHIGDGAGFPTQFRTQGNIQDFQALDIQVDHFDFGDTQTKFTTRYVIGWTLFALFVFRMIPAHLSKKILCQKGIGFRSILIKNGLCVAHAARASPAFL